MCEGLQQLPLQMEEWRGGVWRLPAASLQPSSCATSLFSSSNSSSTASLASSSPKLGLMDWAIPQASRLKYRQQFNTLDKLMSGYLSGRSREPHTRVWERPAVVRVQPGSVRITLPFDLCRSSGEERAHRVQPHPNPAGYHLVSVDPPRGLTPPERAGGGGNFLSHLRCCVCDLRSLADVDRDGRLQGDEFILAMHLVDMAKSGRPLPLTLPQDLVPPSLR